MSLTYSNNAKASKGSDWICPIMGGTDIMEKYHFCINPFKLVIMYYRMVSPVSHPINIFDILI